MSKRSLASPSTSSSKSRKLAVGQTRLDKFFGSDRSLNGLPSNDTKQTVRTQRSIPTAPEIIDVDLLDDDELLVMETPSQESVTTKSAEMPDAGPSNDQPRPTKSMSNSVKLLSSKGSTSGNSDPLYTPLSIDPVIFDPQSAISEASTFQDLPYSFLVHALATICATRSRITILDTLTNAFRTIIAHFPEALLPSLYLLSNTLSPPYSTIELNIGPSAITQAIQHVSGLSSSSFRRLYNATGDPGDVAFAAKSNTRTLIPHPPLLVSFVYKSLLKIATSKGQGATKEKQKIVERLLVAAKGEESRFLVRTLCQNLRVGAVRTSLLTALARSFVLTPVILDDDSIYYISQKFLADIQPIPSSPKKARSTKVSDPAREELVLKFRRAESLVRKVFVQHPDYQDIISALTDGLLDGSGGLTNLAQRVPLTVGIPIYPALGTPIRSFNEIYERLKDLPFSAELKYDGQRAQIHCNKRPDDSIDVRVFSRHLEDMTSKYPDVVALMEEMFKSQPEIQSSIMDSEIVAVDPADGSLRSFQVLSGRARKDVNLNNVEVHVGVFAFDLMYLDGEILLERPFHFRRSLLCSRFPEHVSQRTELARFQHVECCDSEEGQTRVENFWETVAGRHDVEGLMIKLLDSETRGNDKSNNAETRKRPLSAVYDADKRTYSWMKLKKDYVSGLGDSLDLIPVGAWHGNGRKAKWWSPILLAVWDSSKNYPVAMCKCMSGFTDVFYKGLNERYSLDDESDCSRSQLWECETGGLKPDVFFKPQEVWEIRGADVTLSPVSVAAQGLISPSRGLSLRFPRFIRVRDDKGISQASSTSFLANMYQSQQGKGKEEEEWDDLIDVDLESVNEESEEGSNSE